MTKEDASNSIGCETGDNRVEERRRVGERLSAIVAGDDVTNNPCTLVFLLTSFQLFDQESENARLVRIGEVEIIEDIGLIPLFYVSGDTHNQW